MEIPVLVHGKGIYDSDDMKMKYTGMILEGSRIKEMGPFEELGPGQNPKTYKPKFIPNARHTFFI